MTGLGGQSAPLGQKAADQLTGTNVQLSPLALYRPGVSLLPLSSTQP